MTKKAIGYYRVSTLGQEDNTSLEDQREKVRAYCKAQGWTLVAEFEDVASGGNVDRPGYQAALDYIEEHPGEIFAFVVAKLDRVHRHQQNLLVFESNLRNAGIAFVSVSENIDTSNPIGNLIFQILGSFAEFEKETIAKRLRDGRKATAMAGGRTAFKPPFGYDRNWNPIEEEAEQVRAIFQGFLKGKSQASLAREFGKSRQMIHKMLRNRAYTGELSYFVQKEGKTLTVKNHHQPIISPVVFGKVQAKLERQKQNTTC